MQISGTYTNPGSRFEIEQDRLNGANRIVSIIEYFIQPFEETAVVSFALLCHKASNIVRYFRQKIQYLKSNIRRIFSDI